MWVTQPSHGTLRDVGAPAPRVVLGVIHLPAPHPILNGSSPHDLVKDAWVTTQWVLFEFLACLKQVTARHVFGKVQHVTHNLGAQGEWMHHFVLPGRAMARTERSSTSPRINLRLDKLQRHAIRFSTRRQNSESKAA